MRFVVGILLAYSSVLGLLTLTSLNYFPRRKNAFNSEYPTYVQNTLINLGLLTAITYFLARINIQPRVSFNFFIIVMAISTVLNFKSMLFQVKNRFRTNLIISGISIWAFIPGVIKSIREYSFFNMTSILNNDINAYSLASDLFLKTGTANANKLVETDLNSFAMFTQHETPNILIAFVSKIFGLPTWQIMNTVILFAIALSILSTMEVVSTIRPNLEKKWTYLIAMTVVLSPIQIYIFSNYFLGQSLAYAVAMTMVARTLKIHIEKRISKRTLNEIPFLITLAFYTYPIFLLPFSICCLIWYLMMNTREFSGIHRKILTKTSGYVILGVILSLPYISISIKLFVLLNNIDPGWSIPPLSPFSLFLQGDLLRSLSFNLPILIISWICAIGLMIFCLWKINSEVKLSKIELSIFVGTIILGLVLLLSLRDFNLGSYQNWKLISYFIPFVYLVFLLQIKSYRPFRTLLFLLIVASLIAPLNAWRHIFNSKELVVTRDLAQLSMNERLNKLQNVNIDLNPFFESMAAAQLTNGPKIYFISNQYWTRSRNESACTLVRNDDRRNQETERLNATYGLIPSFDKKCLIINSESTYKKIDLKNTKFYKAQVNNRDFLLNGWGEIEEFGVWSIQEYAELGFKLEGEKNGKYSVILHGRAYLPQERKSTEIKLFVNDKFISNFIFTKPQAKIFIPIQAQDGIQNIRIKLQVIDPISPKSEGMSLDQRRLGFGLESISVEVD